jgi:hypothetical protein
MEGYEGVSDLLSNSIKYGLSNKRAIVIWGAVYLVTMLVFFAGYIGGVFLIFMDERSIIAWVLILISLIPILILSVLLAGYVRRCLSGLFEGNETVPDIADLGGIVVDGLKLAAIYIEGIVVMFILFIPSVALILISYRYEEAICGYCLLYPIELVLMILVLVINMVQWAVFADTGSLMKGLNPLNAVRLIKGDLRYAAVAGLAALIIYLILSVVSSILTLLVVTLLLLPFVIMPFYCALIYILARFYQHAKG